MNNQVVDKKTGKFKPEEKFIEFVGQKGSFNFVSNEATISGKYLSGLDLDDVNFKLTIYEDGTVDFDEIETSKTTEIQRERLLKVICDKTIMPWNMKMVIPDLIFKSIKKVKDKTVDLYLSIEYTTPINKLSTMLDESEVEISDLQSSKIDDFLSLFTDDELNQEVKEEDIKESKNSEMNNTNVNVDIIDTNKMMLDSFKKIKEDKIAELEQNLKHHKSELSKFEYEKSQAERKIETAKEDIRLIESRINSIQPLKDPNGYIFFISERMNEKVELDESTYKIIFDKISKIKSIDAKAFMKLFEQGEFQVRIGQKSNSIIEEIADYSKLPKEIKDTLNGIGVLMNADKKLAYVGDLEWHDIVGKFIKNGFTQDPEFDKLCGSNSYSFEKWEDNDKKQVGVKKDKSENMNQFKKLSKFENPTDIVIIGHEDEVGDTFSVTDDESYFSVYVGGKRKLSLGCFGFGSVVTLEEFKKMDIPENDSGVIQGIIVQNFVGEIGIGVLNEDNNISSNFNIDDYINHQIDGDVIVNIPSGFNIYELNEDLTIPIHLLRDSKIEKVIK